MRNCADAAIQLPLERMKVLAGDVNLFGRHSLRPYDSRVCDFLHGLSRALMADEEIKSYPDALTFAFFCRSSNIKRFQSDYDSRESGIRRGCGTVFHVAPSNVPINFAYSLVFALLAGCSNIVRVSSREFAQVSAVCRILNSMLKEYPTILSMILIVRYEHDDDINTALSSVSDGRIIWGGDSTIARFRTYAIKSRCIDIAFPDRHSICVIKSSAVLKLSDSELDKLALNFYNDTYLMDQNACSSPHILFWQGEEFSWAQGRFWNAVAKTAKNKYDFHMVTAVDKLTKLCSDAISGQNFKYGTYSNLLYVLTLDDFPEQPDGLRGQGGYFYQLNWNDLRYLLNNLTQKCQTLTYFGFSSDEIVNIIENVDMLNVDRIVPIGKALDISPLWDGYDIVLALSKVKDVVK